MNFESKRRLIFEVPPKILPSFLHFSELTLHLFQKCCPQRKGSSSRSPSNLCRIFDVSWFFGCVDLPTSEHGSFDKKNATKSLISYQGSTSLPERFPMADISYYGWWKKSCTTRHERNHVNNGIFTIKWCRISSINSSWWFQPNLKNISQTESFPQAMVKMQNL